MLWAIFMNHRSGMNLAMTHSVTYNAGSWLNMRWNQSLLKCVSHDLSGYCTNLIALIKVCTPRCTLFSQCTVICSQNELTSSHSASIQASIISCHASPVATRNSNIDAEAMFLEIEFWFAVWFANQRTGKCDLVKTQSWSYSCDWFLYPRSIWYFQTFAFRWLRKWKTTSASASKHMVRPFFRFIALSQTGNVTGSDPRTGCRAEVIWINDPW